MAWQFCSAVRYDEHKRRLKCLQKIPHLMNGIEKEDQANHIIVLSWILPIPVQIRVGQAQCRADQILFPKPHIRSLEMIPARIQVVLIRNPEALILSLVRIMLRQTVCLLRLMTIQVGRVQCRADPILYRDQKLVTRWFAMFRSMTLLRIQVDLIRNLEVQTLSNSFYSLLP